MSAADKRFYFVGKARGMVRTTRNHTGGNKEPGRFNPDDVPIPRQLKQAFWWSRWGWIFALIFFSFWAVFGAYSRQMPLPAGLFLAAAITAMSYFIGRSINRGIRRTAGLTAAVAGNEAFLTPLGTVDHTGAYVELRFESPDPERSRRAAAVLKVGRFKPLPSSRVKATVYFDAGATDRFIAVEAENKIYWGRLTDREYRFKAWKRFRLGYLVLAAGFVVLLLCLGFEQYKDHKAALAQAAEASESMSWSKTSAAIIDSGLVPVVIKLGRLPVDAFEVRVVYQYTADNRIFKGDRIGFCSQPERNEQQAREKAEFYAQGKTVKVFYNPENPGQAVLEPGGTEKCRKKADLERFGLIAVLIGGALGVVILAAFWFYLAGKKNKIFKNG